MEWYEELDFYDNPLTTNPKMFISELVGVDDLLEELFYRVEAGSMVFLEGADGSGKSAVLQRVIKRFKGKKRVIYFDCEQVRELDIEELMQKRYGLFGRLFRITPKNMIVLLDNVQFLSKRNTEKMKHYFDYGYIKAIVFTGQRYSRAALSISIKDRIGRRVLKLRALTEEEALSLIKKRLEGISFIPDELIKKIFKSSRKNTKRFIENCGKVCEKAINEKRKEVMEEDLQVIK